MFENRLLFIDMRSFYYRYRSYTWLLIIFLAVLFILSSIQRRKRAQNSSKDRGLFRFDSNTRQIQVRNLKGELILQGDLGVKIDPGYSAPEESTKDGLHYTWGDHVILSITKGIKNCLLVDWDTISEDPFTPMDCFTLGKSVWYGGGEMNIASYPTNKASINMGPFYPKTYSGSEKTRQHYSAVVEPYWLSSSGVAIHVDSIVPLHVSVNANGDGKLCLKADTQGYPTHQKPVHLTYRLCFGNNVKSTHTYMASKFFEKPSETVSKSTMRYPICSHKSNSNNQRKLEQFFRGVAIRQFACGHIDLGYRYSLEFNKKTFPVPKTLIKGIQSKKMNVLVTVDTSFSASLSDYKNVPQKFLVNKPGSHSLDLANNDAMHWFIDKVKKFKERYNIDTIRFCCGEIQFPVDKYGLNKDQSPGMIVHNYAKIAANVGKGLDIKVGYKSQSLPLVIKLADRNSEWGREMGLRSLIPMVLSIGLVGYPFVTIGPIGGRPIGDTKPAKELYIRWMQFSVFFPVMEFITYPWDYEKDETVVHVSAEILDIRSMLFENIVTIAEQSVETGAPMIRPMWWISPDDPATYTLHAQFMLGDIYLVAPVLWEGRTVHDVYLPKGVWREMFGKGVKHEIDVGRWITFDVDLRTVVYFECLLCKN